VVTLEEEGEVGEEVEEGAEPVTDAAEAPSEEG
jgi:hypothetical protein